MNKFLRFLIVVLGICLSLTELHGQQLSEQQAAIIRFIDEETPDATRLLARMVNINLGTFKVRDWARTSSFFDLSRINSSRK